MRKSIPVHPVFLASYPILAYFVHNLNELKLGVIFWPLLISLGITLFLWLMANLFFRNFKASAVLISLGLIFFFSYGYVFNLFQKITAQPLSVIQERIFFIAWLGLFILMAYLVFKKIKIKKKRDQLTQFLNITALALVFISLFQIALFYYQTRLMMNNFSLQGQEETEFAQLSREAEYPDIYYLIFDRYANAESLKEYYHYDNQEFLDFLTEKGFYVANQSLANYPITDLSLTSSLNMEYLDSLSESVGQKTTGFWPIISKFANHRVGNFLRKKGYLRLNIASNWWLTSDGKNSDYNYLYACPQPLSIFFLKFLQTTALHPLLSGLITVNEKSLVEPLTFEARARETIFYQLETLKKIPHSSEPKFVFAHILLPHEPYIFDQDGRFISREEALAGEERELYLNQLIYTNKLIRNLVKKLLTKTKGKAVIILQADEGPYPPRYLQNEYYFDWRFATPDEIKEKFGILNAYYLPGSNDRGFYPTISPVNTFRLIFNLYFKTNLPLLPDRVYGIQNRRYLYRYFDLTGKF